MDAVTSSAYTAARTAAAVAGLSLAGWGWVQVTGPDRLAFLQRLSTNDFRALAPGRGLPTVLTSPTGRVIALLIAYAAEDALYLRTEPNRAGAVARYLGNLIFWNDHVAVADLTAETAQWGLYGPGAGAALVTLLEAPLPQPPAETPPYAWARAHVADTNVAAHRGGPLEAPAWTVTGSRADAAAIGAALARLGPSLDPAAQEQLRVEAGIPAWGKESSDQVTPLEAGMAAAVHFNKGCYTGQEVIARMSNYDKIPRRLMGLLLPNEAGPELAGAAVAAGRGRPGYVGTVVSSPALGRPVALAVVPRDAEAGSEVTVNGPSGPVTATVTPLPFVQPSKSIDA